MEVTEALFPLSVREQGDPVIIHVPLAYRGQVRPCLDAVLVQTDE